MQQYVSQEAQAEIKQWKGSYCVPVVDNLSQTKNLLLFFQMNNLM